MCVKFKMARFSLKHHTFRCSIMDHKYSRCDITFGYLSCHMQLIHW